MLKSLITSILAASGDLKIADLAEPFVAGISRHFAFLYAAGTGNVRGPEGRLLKWHGLRELDPHVFLEALIAASPKPYPKP